ncbi:MAG: IS91 family transposase [Bacteroidales bacterium]|nr:IS91 family transposase [Bacteroidales bacterium]
MNNKTVTISDIFRQFGPAYIKNHKTSPQERGIIRLISACRTAYLGSHKQKCDNCGFSRINYNSCRNRHCPVCQQKDRQQWLSKRMEELLDVGYYHVVFTLPHELNYLCLQNRKLMYNILFKAASRTIMQLARDPKHLGAETGLTTVLHTWGQNIMEHPHLHCILPAGGLTSDKKHWVYSGDKFFVYVKVISRLFRGKFLACLKEAYQNGELDLKGSLSDLKLKSNFNQLVNKLYNKDWVVNIQPPFARPEKVLEYLSRYVNRIAITDNRITKIENGKVHFTWKDYRSVTFRKMKLDINEFIRRFLLHLLPDGFQKIRYYGLFANRFRAENISLCKQTLERKEELEKQEAMEDGKQFWEKKNNIWDEILKAILTYKKPNCPVCGMGCMIYAGPAPNPVPG